MIQDKSNANNNVQQAAQPSQAQTFASVNASPMAGVAAAQTTGWSIRNMGSIGRNTVGMTPASKVLSESLKAFNERLAEMENPTFEYKLFPLDMGVISTIGISAIVLASRDKTGASKGISFYTWLLEGSIDPIAPTYQQTPRGTTIEVTRTIADYNDKNMINEIKRVLNSAYPQQELLNSDADVLPRDFNYADANATYMMVANGVTAVSTELDFVNPAFTDVNLQTVKRDSSITIQKRFSNHHVMDAANQPLRSDVTITMSAGELNNNNGNLNNNGTVDRTVQIAEARGYVDLLWNPAVAEQANQFVATTGVANTQKYQPHLIITSLASSALLTPAAQLMALLPMLTLRDNNKWMEAFRPVGFSTDKDLRDFGAVGLEIAFFPDKGFMFIDTKEDGFRDQNLYQLIAASVSPNLLVSLDIPACGRSTWHNSIFAADANGNLQARQGIVNAANMLTNNNFAKYFQHGVVSINQDNAVHTGYYVDAKGIRRDIREIDYLAILNLLGATAPDQVQAFSDTYLNRNIPLLERLSIRKRIITNVLGESNVTFTGIATRSTLTPDFINALVRGVADCQFAWREVDQARDTNFARATGSFGDMFNSTESYTTQLNRGFGNVGTVNNGINNFSNRWL